jgi:hypothetical protein
MMKLTKKIEEGLTRPNPIKNPGKTY